MADCTVCGGTLRVETAGESLTDSGFPGEPPSGSTLVLVHKPEECIAALRARVERAESDRETLKRLVTATEQRRDEYRDQMYAEKGRAERAERVVGLAWRFTASLGGAKLRKSELDALDPLLVAMNAMPMADFARCLESARALAATGDTGDDEGKVGEQ